MSNSQTPPKFTIVKETVQPEHRWSYKTIQTPALLFQTELVNPTEQLEPILKDSYVQKHVGSVVLAQAKDNGTLIHGDLTMAPTPDKASASDTVMYLRDGKVRSFRILDRFTQCMEPARDLMGCAECPSKGTPCIRGDVHGDPLVSDFEGGLTGRHYSDAYSAMVEDLKHKQSTVAGYTYVSNVMVAPSNEVFVRNDPKAGGIEWEALEEREKMRATAAAKAAQTRKFKKDNCARCVAKDAGCTLVHWCDGAYPTAEALDKEFLERYSDRLNAVGPEGRRLEQWQLYAVMWLAGTAGEAVWKRRQVLLGGLTWYDRSYWGVRIAAKKKVPDPAHDITWAWDRLRKVFPQLPTGPGQKFTERPSDQALAKFFAAMEQGRYAPRRNGFHGYAYDPFSFIGVDPRTGCLTTGRCDGYGASDNTSAYRAHVVETWTEFFARYGRIPVLNRRRA